MPLYPKKYAAVLLITIIAMAITISFFLLLPLLHSLFFDAITGNTMSPRRTDSIMEYKKPEEKKTVQKKRLVKQTSLKRPGGAKASPMQFRFAPDLSAEGEGAAVMETGELTPEIFEEGETDEPVIPLYRPPLSFSERARELEIEGILEAIFIVNTQGKVASVEIVRSPHPSIAAEARKIISTWRFKPAKNKGVPVQVRLRQIAEFKLE